MFVKLLPGQSAQRERGPGPAAKFFQGREEWERGSGGCGGGGVWLKAGRQKVGSTCKFADKEGKERPEQQSVTPRRQRGGGSQRGLSPWRPPDSPTRRAQPREGREELTYFGAKVAALGPAEGGERGAEREQGEQEAAGGSRGGRHGPWRRGARRCGGLRGGAHALGSRRRSLWAPLSSEGTEFGFLEGSRLGGEGIAPESARLLFSFPFFDLSSA